MPGRSIRFFLVIGLIVMVLAALSLWLEKNQSQLTLTTSLSLQGIFTTTDSADFQRAFLPRKFRFPLDHGPHLNFKNEWWYLTGNLSSSDGQEFGYQFTLFRDAFSRQPTPRRSAWAANQIYMAHFGFADINDGRFNAFERFRRGAVGLAGTTQQPLRFWLQDWVLSMNNNDLLPGLQLSIKQDDIFLQLELKSEKPPVLHGNQGLSKKGTRSGEATYYYSLTRLYTTGTVTRGNDCFSVQGYSWFDREWGTNALSRDTIGWDWFSLQFENGQELMYYQLRRMENRIDSCSSATLIERNGRSRTLSGGEIRLEVLSYWTNRRGDRYPALWRLQAPAEKINVIIEPAMADQELNLSIAYWEGAVRFNGQYNRVAIRGKGYVELTGYGKP